MSNDKTTLADVQPGGKVRLGDQAERARFEAWAREDPRYFNIARSGADYYYPTVQDAWIAWQAALSAQPSPGGQGDALTILAKHMRRIAAAHNVPELAADAKIVESGYELDFWMDAAYCALLEVLAARQPVGEPVWVEVRREGDRTFPRVMAKDQAEAFLRTCNVGPLPTTHPLYAAPTAQAVDPWSVIDRVAKNWDGCSIGAAIRAEAEKLIGKPAQAVGLGPGLDAAASLIQKKADDYADEHGYDDMGALSFGRGHHADVKTDHHCFMLELVDELRALIDSQAVGNG